MKKIHFTIYVCDNEFFLQKENGQAIKETFKSLECEEIIDSSLFKEEFSKFLQKHSIRISLFGKNIVFIKSKNLSPLAQEKYKEIFNDYFRRIEFIDLEDIFQIDNENGVLFLTQKYLDYYYRKKNKKEQIRIDLKIFNDSNTKAIQHIMNNLYKPKNLIVLGPIENIASITDEIHKKYNVETTFPEAYFTYIFEECKK